MAEGSLPEIETREIPGFGGFYRAGIDGSIWTCRKRGGAKDATAEWREIKGRPHVRSGHLDIVLRKPGDESKRLWKVHHLVLWAFVGPAPPKMECRHLNGNPADNRPENLKWGTRRENVHDAIAHGTFYRSGRCRYSEHDYENVAKGISRLRGRKLKEIATELGVPLWLVHYLKYRRMKEMCA